MLLGESSFRKTFYKISEEERNSTVPEFVNGESFQEATDSETAFSSEEK